MSSLGEQLLATREGAAFLACGAAVGRLELALTDPGLTLCLAAHALAEVRRGTDGGRLDGFVAEPGGWLVDAAGAVDRADTRWWSEPADGRILRQADEHTAGLEVLDRRGRRRSAAGEAAAHIHTFTSRPSAGAVRRLRLEEGAGVLELDTATDVDDRITGVLAGDDDPDAPAVHLTLRGALTIDRRALPRWPWPVAGVHWPTGVPATGTVEEACGPEPRVTHDHAWPPIGRPYDPRFDEGDEVDGSELAE